MNSSFQNGRRDFLNRAGQVGALASLGLVAQAGALSSAMAAGKNDRTGVRAAAGSLPGRGEYLIRGGHVLTMDDKAGDMPGADVHVKNGAIVAVGQGLKLAAGATVIDARGMMVLPGLVETHWHMWNTLLRSMSGEVAARGYFPLSETLGQFFSPTDMYLGALLSSAEALNSGITTVHDWCHNTRSPAHVDQDILALQGSGIRARFGYGYPMAHPREQSVDLGDLRRVQQQWFSGQGDGLLTLGYAARGTRYSGAYPIEWEAARKMGLPISVHANITKRFGNETEIETFYKDGFLGPDVQVIHAITAPPAAIEAMAKTGTSVSLSPYTEMRIGFGFPQTGTLLAGGVLVTLSVDTAALSGNADMFGVMKAILNVENANAESEFKLTPRRVLQMATIDGAKGLGIADKVGSLVPGKRADIIMVRSGDINMGPMTDASHLLVEAAQPSNVDTVMVDGRILKRKGKLTAIHPDQVVRASAIALAGVRKRAGWV
ncbi:MAG: amidohydrolase family protein [Pseudomonadota bacterium]